MLSIRKPPEPKLWGHYGNCKAWGLYKALYIRLYGKCKVKVGKKDVLMQIIMCKILKDVQSSGSRQDRGVSLYGPSHEDGCGLRDRAHGYYRHRSSDRTRAHPDPSKIQSV